MKKYWLLLNTVSFAIAVGCFALAGIAGAPVHVLAIIGFLLALWAFMIILVMQMRRQQEQIHYAPKDVDQSVEEGPEIYYNENLLEKKW